MAEMVGAATNVKPVAVATPPGLVIETEPVAPAPTVAIIWVAVFETIAVAAVPPKLTAEALLRLVPLMVILTPLPPKVG